MSEKNHDPRQLERLLFDRRRFLALSALGTGAVLGLGACGGSNPGRAAIVDPTELSGTDASPAPGAAANIYHEPYALDVSSSLSEDHFMVQLANIDPATDTVYAYSRTDGHVEAVLLKGSTITQVYRDPAAAGGWNTRVITAGGTLATGVTQMVASMAAHGSVLTGAANWYLHVFYRTADGNLHHWQEDAPVAGVSSGKFSDLLTVPWGTDVKGPLRLASNNAGELLAYTLTPSSAPGKNDAKLHFVYLNDAFENPGTQGELTGFAMAADRPGSAAVAPGVLSGPLFYVSVPTPDASSAALYAYQGPKSLAASIKGSMSLRRTQPAVLTKPQMVASVDHIHLPDYVGGPFLLARTVSQDLYTLYPDGNNVWQSQQLTLPAQSVDDRKRGLQWSPSTVSQHLGKATANAYLNLFTVVDGTLSVVRQLERESTDDILAPVFNPAVPLQPGISLVSSQVRASNGDELIVVGDDGSLQMLARTPDDGWVATQIHLPAEEPIDVDAYRVQLTLEDDWGIPVAGKDLQVTADSPVIAIVGDRGLSLSSEPVTVTTDAQGQVTLALLADGLSAPTLSVSGGGLPSAVQVSPSAPINTYMTGKQPLNYIPTLDTSVLAGATTDDGAPVFPLAKSDPGVAASAVGVLASAAISGADPQHGGSQSYLTLGSAPPTLTAISVNGVALSFSNLVHDAIHAIKTGAAKVKQVVIKWDDTVKGWVSEATAGFEAWADQVVKTVINGFEDAAHVFHSVINHLGAAVVKALKWLEIHVLKLLADTVTLAGHYEDWLGELVKTSHDLLDKAKSGSDTWLIQQKAAIHKDFATVKRVLGDRSVDSLKQPPKLSTTLEQSVDAGTDQRGADSNWLLRKVTQDNPQSLDPPKVSADLGALLGDLQRQGGTGWDDFQKAAHSLLDALGALVSNPKNFGSANVGQVLDAVEALIDVALDLLDGIFDALLDLLKVAIDVFGEVLRVPMPLDKLPLVGPLLKAAGMTRPLTIGGLISMLMGFPTVLSYKVAHLSFGATPFRGASNGVQASADDETIRDDLNFTAGGAKIFEALSGAIAALLASQEEGEVPAFYEWVEVVTPAIIAALTLPAHAEELPFTSTIELRSLADVLNAAFWWTGVLPGVFAATGIYVKKYAPAEVNSSLVDTVIALDGAIGMMLAVVAALASEAEHPSGEAVLRATAGVMDRIAPTLLIGRLPHIVSLTKGISPIVGGTVGSVCTTVAGVMTFVGAG